MSRDMWQLSFAVAGSSGSKIGRFHIQLHHVHGHKLYLLATVTTSKMNLDILFRRCLANCKVHLQTKHQNFTFDIVVVINIFTMKISNLLNWEPYAHGKSNNTL